MIYAIDTEFMEDGKTIQLISLGLVAEDGRTYYRQVIERDYARANRWVQTHVIPQLTQCPGSRSKNEHWSHWSTTKTGGCVRGCPWQWQDWMGEEVRAFVGKSPVFVGYYCAYDWVALCQLYGTMMDLPESWPMYCRDLRQWLDEHELEGITQPEDDQGIHHALRDALWIMQTYQCYVLGHGKNKPTKLGKCYARGARNNDAPAD